MELVLVRKVVPVKVLAAVQVSVLAVALLGLVSWAVRDLGLALALVLVSGMVLVLVWEWALVKELVEVRLVRSDSVQEWVQAQRELRVQAQLEALVQEQLRYSSPKKNRPNR